MNWPALISALIPLIVSGFAYYQAHTAKNTAQTANTTLTNHLAPATAANRALLTWEQLSPEARQLIAAAARSVAKDFIQQWENEAGNPYPPPPPTTPGEPLGSPWTAPTPLGDAAAATVGLIPPKGPTEQPGPGWDYPANPAMGGGGP